MRLIITLILVCVFSVGCASTASEPKISSTKPIQHVVLVWLKPEYKVTYVEELSVATEQLKNIEGVESIHTGRAISSKRLAVDDSFDLGIIFEFNTLAALQSYVDHPLHKEFLKDFVIGKVDRILIYDF